jgi:hypothetical protein
MLIGQYTVKIEIILLTSLISQFSTRRVLLFIIEL